MSIEELYDNDYISTRTFNACQREGFLTSDDIIEYQHKNGSFANLRNCGRKSYEELDNVCKRFSAKIEHTEISHFPDSESRSDIQNFLSKSIQSLFDDDEITVRTYNVCYFNDLQTVKNICDYYKKNNGFQDLRNCGLKTRTELERVYQSALPLLIDNLSIEKSDQISTKELSRTHREIINNAIRYDLESLSVRTRNALSNYLENNISLRNIQEKLLSVNNRQLLQIQNLGSKSFNELIGFKEKLQDFISQLSEIEIERELFELKNAYFLKRKFPDLEFPESISKSGSLFLILNFLIDSNFFKNENENFIFKHCLNVFGNEEKMIMADAGNNLEITRERVRQLREQIVDKLEYSFDFVRDIHDKEILHFKNNLIENYVSIDSAFSNLANHRASTNFTKEFILFILYIYLKPDYQIVGELEDVLIKDIKRRNHYNWKNFYLLKTELADIFNAKMFVSDLDKRLNARLDEDYSLIFKSYVFDFIKGENSDKLTDILPFAEVILNTEFDLFLDEYDRIIFKRNTVKQGHDYAYEALEEIGEPAKVEEIYKKVTELYPDYETSEGSIRASMKRKDGFVPISRSSTFGLKKWENEIENFKGGTIRSLTEEFLSKSDLPQHISNISEYVLMFRPNTNEKSILYNLKAEESNTFIFFKNAFVGLNRKSYPDNYAELEDTDKIEAQPWEYRFHELQNFISQENRLPLSSGASADEIKLARWINNQKYSIRQGELDRDKVESFHNLVKDVKSINGRRYSNSMQKYPQLISFIKENKRLPKHNYNGEETLYQFFYKQKIFASNNELHINEKSKYDEIMNLLKSLEI